LCNVDVGISGADLSYGAIRAPDFVPPASCRLFDVEDVEEVEGNAAQGVETGKPEGFVVSSEQVLGGGTEPARCRRY